MIARTAIFMRAAAPTFVGVYLFVLLLIFNASLVANLFAFIVAAGSAQVQGSLSVGWFDEECDEWEA